MYKNIQAQNKEILRKEEEKWARLILNLAQYFKAMQLKKVLE